MAKLLPNLRQLVKYSRGITDKPTKRAVEELEEVIDDLLRRLAKLEA